MESRRGKSSEGARVGMKTCVYVDKEEIRAIIADRFNVDLNDVKFGVGMGANVFNIPEEKQDDTSRIS